MVAPELLSILLCNLHGLTAQFGSLGYASYKAIDSIVPELQQLEWIVLM